VALLDALFLVLNNILFTLTSNEYVYKVYVFVPISFPYDNIRANMLMYVNKCIIMFTRVHTPTCEFILYLQIYFV